MQIEVAIREPQRPFRFSLRSLCTFVILVATTVFVFDFVIMSLFGVRPVDIFRGNIPVKVSKFDSFEVQLTQKLSDFYDYTLWIRRNETDPWSNLALIGKEEDRLEKAEIEYDADNESIRVKIPNHGITFVYVDTKSLMFVRQTRIRK